MASTGQFARCVLRFSKSACIQIRIITISFFKRFRILRVKQCLDGVRLQPNHIYINISSIFSKRKKKKSGDFLVRFGSLRFGWAPLAEKSLRLFGPELTGLNNWLTWMACARAIPAAIRVRPVCVCVEIVLILRLFVRQFVSSTTSIIRHEISW